MGAMPGVPCIYILGFVPTADGRSSVPWISRLRNMLLLQYWCLPADDKLPVCTNLVTKGFVIYGLLYAWLVNLLKMLGCTTGQKQ